MVTLKIFEKMFLNFASCFRYKCERRGRDELWHTNHESEGVNLYATREDTPKRKSYSLLLGVQPRILNSWIWRDGCIPR